MNDHGPGSLSSHDAGASEPTHAATATRNASNSQSVCSEPQLWPVFICYRQVDGLDAARRLHELIDKRNITGPNGEIIELDVYLDQTMPAVADWREIHKPYLERARAFIVICTPGSKVFEGPDDWVHMEINWWLGHRNTAPILIDPLGQGIRYVPTAVRDRWPEIQRIRLVEAEWNQLPPAQLEQKAIALRRQILGNILPSGAAIYEAELKAERRRSRQLARALASSIALLALAAALSWYAFTKQMEAEHNRAEAETSRAAATVSAREAASERDKALSGQSQFLADLARQQREDGDAGTAILLALEALPDAAGPDRPYVPQAEFALNTALHSLRERRLYVADSDLFGVALSPNGKRILAISNSKLPDDEGGERISQARLLDAESGERIGEPFRTSIFRGTFSPDSRRIIVVDDHTVHLLDTETAKLTESPKFYPDATDGNRTGSIQHAEFSHDGNRMIASYYSGMVQLWDTNTGKQIGKPLRGHTQPPYIATFSADDKRIGTASYYDAIVWDIATGKQTAGPTKVRSSLAFRADLRAIIATSSDAEPNVFDVATGQPIGAPLLGHWYAAQKNDDDLIKDPVRSAQFSADGKFIATGSPDTTIRLWDTTTHKQVGEPLKGHSGAVREVAFSSDGKRVVSASSDNTVRLWDVETRKPVTLTLTGHSETEAVTSAAFSRDGKRIVTASSDLTARVWDSESGQLIGKPLIGHTFHVQSAVFSPDGKRIVTASSDNTIRLWDAATGDQIGRPLTGHDSFVYNAAFSYDGKRIVSASEDMTVRVWNAETGEQIGQPFKGHTGAVHKAIFSPDDKLILTASSDKTARLWDAETGVPFREPFIGHRDAVYDAEFSPDGKRVVTASFDGTARVWDVFSGQILGQPLEGHESSVRSAVFSPDGKRIVTASDDQTVRLWDAATGKEIQDPLRSDVNIVFSAAFSPDGKRIVATFHGKAKLWPIAANTQELISLAKADVPRCLTQRQRATFFLSAKPPLWCIDLGKWPFSTAEWKAWASEIRSGKDWPLPASP